MPGPDIDLEQPNAIGGLDRIVTNFALSVIAVPPTFGAALFAPWRLVPLVERDEPDGRDGLLLSPGAFLPLSLLVVLIIASMFTTSEAVEFDQSFIGPGLAISVSAAVSEGDIWKTVSLIMPIYAVTILLGLVGQVLRRWAGEWWTLRTSLRAAFYVTATMTCWIVLTSTAINVLRVYVENAALIRALYSLNALPILAICLWVYFWMFRVGGSHTSVRSGILTVAMLNLAFLNLLLIDNVALS
ncbi:MAG: hypothetical protein AAF292_10300 [Pseudomonadota bacterium]